MGEVNEESDSDSTESDSSYEDEDNDKDSSGYNLGSQEYHDMSLCYRPKVCYHGQSELSQLHVTYLYL